MQVWHRRHKRQSANSDRLIKIRNNARGPRQARSQFEDGPVLGLQPHEAWRVMENRSVAVEASSDECMRVYVRVCVCVYGTSR